MNCSWVRGAGTGVGPSITITLISLPPTGEFGQKYHQLLEIKLCLERETTPSISQDELEKETKYDRGSQNQNSFPAQRDAFICNRLHDSVSFPPNLLGQFLYQVGWYDQRDLEEFSLPE